MTHAEQSAERLYREQERTGLNCGAEKPTKSQQEQITKEVQDDMKRIEFNKVMEGWG